MRQTLWVLNEKRIGLLGLAFKGNTDDIRSSVAVKLALRLIEEGAVLAAFDPKGMEKCAIEHPSIPLVADPYAAANGADALVIATEWTQFRDLDWKRIKDSMRTPVVFDGRNLMDRSHMIALGFEYHCIGR